MLSVITVFHIFRYGLLAVPENICLINTYCEIVFNSKICL